jgi:hypothetical protein
MNHMKHEAIWTRGFIYIPQVWGQQDPLLMGFHRNATWEIDGSVFSSGPPIDPPSSSTEPWRPRELLLDVAESTPAHSDRGCSTWPNRPKSFLQTLYGDINNVNGLIQRIQWGLGTSSALENYPAPWRGRLTLDSYFTHDLRVTLLHHNKLPQLAILYEWNALWREISFQYPSFQLVVQKEKT